MLPTSSNSASAPAVAPEDGVRAVVEHLQDTWNRKDAPGFLAAFSKNAKIMVGKEQRVMSKEEYKGMFPDLFIKYGTIKYKEPEIKVAGNHADLEVVCTIVDNEDVWLIRKMQLIYTNGTWLIEKSTYTVYFRGPGDPRDRPRDRGEELD